MMYLSSLQDVKLLQESIDIDERYIESLVNRDKRTLILVDDAGFEVKRFEFDVDDIEHLAAARERIKKNKKRLSLVRGFIAELLEGHPELAPESSEPVDYSLPGQTFDIWAEGYVASGDRGDATYMGSVKAASFDEAVAKHMAQNPQDAHYYRRHEDGHWSFWACRLFDNEKDARKNFG